MIRVGEFRKLDPNRPVSTTDRLIAPHFAKKVPRLEHLFRIDPVSQHYGFSAKGLRENQPYTAIGKIVFIR